MPRPGDAHKRLAALVGDWSGDETLHPSTWDPAGGTATARISNRWIVDGFAVVQDYEQRRGDVVTFRGHGVFWFDPSTDEYVLHWWDSIGGLGGAYRGGFDGETLVLGAPNPQGGHSRTLWTATGPDTYVFLMEFSPDGETWLPAMQGAYRKTSSRAPVARKAASKKKAPTKASKKRSPKKQAPDGKAGRSAAGGRRKAPAQKSGIRKTARKRASGSRAATRKSAKKAGRRTARR